jgi:hypothetical protein
LPLREGTTIERLYFYWLQAPCTEGVIAAAVNGLDCTIKSFLVTSN